MISEVKLKNSGLKGIPIGQAGVGVPNRGSWRTFKPVIDYSKCIKCHMCWLHCPDSAYSIDNKGYPREDFYVCKGCLVCVKVCPVKCIKGEIDMHRGKRST